MSGKELARRGAAPSAQKRSGAGVARKAAPKKAGKKAAAKKAAPKKAAKKAVPAKKAAKKVAKKAPAKKAAKKTPSAKKAAGAPRRSPRRGQPGGAGPTLGLPQLPSPPTDPLAVLGLREPFTVTDLRRAWRVYAARHHPDQGGDAATFARGRMAYDELRSRPR